MALSAFQTKAFRNLSRHAIVGKTEMLSASRYTVTKAPIFLHWHSPNASCCYNYPANQSSVSDTCKPLAAQAGSKSGGGIRKAKQDMPCWKSKKRFSWDTEKYSDPRQQLWTTVCRGTLMTRDKSTPSSTPRTERRDDQNTITHLQSR